MIGVLYTTNSTNPTFITMINLFFISVIIMKFANITIILSKLNRTVYAIIRDGLLSLTNQAFYINYFKSINFMGFFLIFYVIIHFIIMTNSTSKVFKTLRALFMTISPIMFTFILCYSFNFLWLILLIICLCNLSLLLVIFIFIRLFRILRLILRFIVITIITPFIILFFYL